MAHQRLSLHDIGRRLNIYVSMEDQMSCCHELACGKNRAFFCQQCPKEEYLLCEDSRGVKPKPEVYGCTRPTKKEVLCLDCATFCHPEHDVSEINIVEHEPLFCECGTAEDKICLLDPAKPQLNQSFFLLTSFPTFYGAYHTRRRELFLKNAGLYIERGVKLAENNNFLGAMEDIMTALSWDFNLVQTKILRICEAKKFFRPMMDIGDKVKASIELMEFTIMASAEVFIEFLESLRRCCDQRHGEGKVVEKSVELSMFIAILHFVGEEVMEVLWRRASDFDVVVIGSEHQFSLYTRHVMRRREQKPRLVLDLKHFLTEESAVFTGKVKECGFEYDTLTH